MSGALEPWDVVLIDCPPSLGQLTINALTAADAVLVVTAPRAPSAAGVARITRTLATVRQHDNPDLRLGGILVNLHLGDRSDRVAWVDRLRAGYGHRMLDVIVPEREIVNVANSASAPLSAYGARARDVVGPLTAVGDHLLKPVPTS